MENEIYITFNQAKTEIVGFSVDSLGDSIPDVFTEKATITTHKISTTDGSYEFVTTVADRDDYSAVFYTILYEKHIPEKKEKKEETEEKSDSGLDSEKLHYEIPTLDLEQVLKHVGPVVSMFSGIKKTLNDIGDDLAKNKK